MTALPSQIRARIDYRLAKHTRIHLLPTDSQGNLWIKREDELSAGISGSKLRKYSSLVPFLKDSKVQTVGIIGGPNSNNLVGLIQILRENSIKPLAFIREAADQTVRGNSLFLNMLLSDDEKRIISRDKWDSVLEIAKRETERVASDCHIIEEGAFGMEALWGAMTLAESLLENEGDNSILFEKIYIDSGTGLSAIGLILGLELIDDKRANDREIIITLIAGEESEFLEKLADLRTKLIAENGLTKKSALKLRFLKPVLSPKFGSVNKSLFDCCISIARDEGILMDPTYSVKHYETVRIDLRSSPSKEKALFIFNGSPLGILGFQERLDINP